MNDLLREVLTERADRVVPGPLDTEALIQRGRRLRRRRTALGAVTGVVLAVGGVTVAQLDRLDQRRAVQVADSPVIASPWADAERLHVGRLSVPRPPALRALIPVGDAAAWTRNDQGGMFVLTPDGQVRQVGSGKVGVPDGAGDLLAWAEDQGGNSATYVLRVYDVARGEAVASTTFRSKSQPAILNVTDSVVAFSDNDEVWSWRWSGDGGIEQFSSGNGRVLDVAGSVTVAFDGPRFNEAGFGTARILDDARELARFERVRPFGWLGARGAQFLTVRENGNSEDGVESVVLDAKTGRVTPLRADGVRVIGGSWDLGGRITATTLPPGISPAPAGEEAILQMVQHLRVVSCDPSTGECLPAELPDIPATDLRLSGPVG